MKLFIAGLLVGSLVGSAVAGYSILFGWTVTVNGTTICEDPYMNTAAKEIECD